MSEEDIKTLRLVYGAAGRQDWNAALEAMDSNIEWKSVLAGTHHGHDEVRRFFEDMTAPFEKTVFEPEEFFDHGDQIVVFVRMRVRPSGSDAFVENRVGHLWTMREGKAVRCRTFPRREDALEAAGLSE